MKVFVAGAADVRRRRFPVIGKGTGLFSCSHVDAAAAATAAIAGRAGDEDFQEATR